MRSTRAYHGQKCHQFWKVASNSKSCILRMKAIENCSRNGQRMLTKGQSHFLLNQMFFDAYFLVWTIQNWSPKTIQFPSSNLMHSILGVGHKKFWEIVIYDWDDRLFESNYGLSIFGHSLFKFLQSIHCDSSEFPYCLSFVDLRIIIFKDFFL